MNHPSPFTIGLRIYADFYRFIPCSLAGLAMANSMPLSTAHGIPCYTYIALKSNEIRLLRLKRTNKSTGIQGSLIHRKLDDKSCKFIAISYVWGDDKSVGILETSKGAIQITASCQSILQRLALKHNSLLVWIDGICIDQANTQEKANQVSLMAKIYSQAELVLADLGPAAEESELVPETVKKIIERVDDGLSSDRRRHLGEIALFKLLCRPWFRRVWIIQEFLMAGDLHFICGSWDLYWRHLYEALNRYASGDIVGWYIHSGGLNPDPGYSLYSGGGDRVSGLGSGGVDLDPGLLMSGHRAFIALSEAKLHLLGGGAFTLLELLHSFATHQASLLRDRLFAFRNVAVDAGDAELEPDYDTPFEIIVRRYAAYFVRNGQTPRLISSARPASQSPGFPSWIPNWTQWHDGNPSSFTEDEAVYSAADGKQDASACDEDADILKVHGAMIDDITQVVDITYTNEERPRVFERLAQTTNIYYMSDQCQGPITSYVDRQKYYEQIDKVFDSLRSYPTGEDLQEVRWRTLIGNRAWGGQIIADSDGMGLAYHASRKQCATEGRSRSMEFDARSLAQLSDTFLCRFDPLTSRFRFGRTSLGYVGLFPKETKSRDSLCLISGCSVPFVLRPSEKRNGMFRLVGKCYVHGIMEGGALARNTWRFDTVYIC